MKKIVSLFVALLSLSGVYAQKTMVEINGFTALKSITAVVSLENPKKRGVAQVANNTETLTIDELIPNELCIMGAEERICFVMPTVGETLKVTISNGKFVFSGAGEKINNYLQALSHDTFYSMENTLVNAYMSNAFCKDYLNPDMKILCAEDYVEKVKSIRDNSLRKLKKAEIDNKEVEAKLEILINDLYWEMLLKSYSLIKFKEMKAPVSMLKLIDNYDFNAPRFMTLSKKDEVLRNYLKVQEDYNRIKYTLTDYIAQKALCIKNSEVREYYVFNELNRLIERKEMINIEQLTATCKPFISEKGMEQYNKICGEVTMLTGSNRLDGVPAEPFEFENQNGEMVKLSDFKGKLVYIDVWATWCGPCKQEIPKLKALEKEMTGENVVFISLSVDNPDKVDEWKKFLKENDMHGITLATKKGFKVPFVQKYGITAIPRFMLIGTDGTMIANNCWRPSDPRLKEYLHSLLTKKQ